MKAKRHIQVLVFAILMVALFSGFSNAQPERWQIDSVHSNIFFNIRHIFATVRGFFDDFSGTVLFDPSDLSGSQATFTVQVNSIDTNNTKRDNHLRSEAFFAADQFPEMIFSSTRIKPLNGNQYQLEGNLTIKGITKLLTAKLTYLGLRDNPLMKGKKVAGFETEFTINRLDYQVGTGKFAALGAVGKDVHVLVTLELSK